MPSSMRDHGAGAPRPTGCEVTRPSRPRCANGPEPRIRGEEGSRRSGRTCLTAHTPREGGHRVRGALRDLVLLDPVPHVEEEAAARLEHAPGFPVAGPLVREEHGAE